MKFTAEEHRFITIFFVRQCFSAIIVSFRFFFSCGQMFTYKMLIINYKYAKSKETLQKSTTTEFLSEE